jgi:hypothetical protein
MIIIAFSPFDNAFASMASQTAALASSAKRAKAATTTTLSLTFGQQQRMANKMIGLGCSCQFSVSKCDFHPFVDDQVHHAECVPTEL